MTGGGGLGSHVVVDLGVGDLVDLEGYEGYYLGCLEGFGWPIVGPPSVQPDQDVLRPS